MKWPLALFLLVSGTVSMAQPPADPRLKGLDTLVKRILKDWNTPGVSIAVVEKNKVIYAGGFGYRDYEKKLPVTAHTLYAIGSCTKAFTSSLLGMLEKEGRLELDKPARDYLPELRFYTDELNNRVTIRDMMTHRTGLPRHDLSWYGSDAGRMELLKRVRYQEPSKGLREMFQYNNFMFLAQGMIAEKLYGKSWELIMKEKILQPLGMSATNFSVTEMEKSGDRSLAYTLRQDSILSVIPYRNIDAIGPAGSLNSNANDMSKWLITWINGGKYNGKEIIPSGYVTQATSQQMALPGGQPSRENPDIHLGAYGLGWFLSSYRGHYRVEHGGGIDGFITSTGFFPTDSIGIFVVSSNGTTTALVRNYISDRMLNLPARNWNKMQLEERAKSRAAAASMKKSNNDSLGRKPGTLPAHPLRDYSGSYEHPGYGTARLNLDRDTLWISYNSGNKQTTWLSHYHFDIFKVLDKDNPAADQGAPRVRFNTGYSGDVESFDIALEPTVSDIKFKRQLDSVHLSRADLEKFTGEYQLAAITTKVYLKNDKTLVFVVPGQPEYELIPVKEDLFKIKILEGFSVRFIRDEKGVYSAMDAIQPNGTFRAQKKMSP